MIGTYDIEPERLEKLKVRAQDYIKECPKLAPLRDKLLSLGGLELVACMEDDWEIDRFLNRGEVYGPHQTFIKGRDCACHSNSAWLWKKKKYRIVTGYALSDDGLWRQHTWALNKKGVVETTLGREMYFGYILTDQESEDFYWDNL